jgi:predicted ATP-dependent serine protease
LDYEKGQKNQRNNSAKNISDDQSQNDSVPSDLGNKIISSQRLEQMVFKALNFQGKWREFIGQPSIEFFMVIHGRAGSGKSTFSVQFAYYLAENFGSVLYISGEEGFSKTLKDKVVSNEAISENLYFADLHNLEEILTNVPSNRFNFIIVDSLNNLKIDVFGIRRMRETFKGSAMIAITQSTKDGKMRGSNEVIHDCDIEVMVEKGEAKSIKNRFQPTDRLFEVFERNKEENVSDKYTLAIPKNTV